MKVGQEARRVSRGPHRRCEGYWKEYDAKYRAFDKRALFRYVVGKAEELGPPFSRVTGRRGRNFSLTPCQYAALFVVAVFYDMTERDVEQEAPSLAGKHIDHSTFGKIIDRIPERYLLQLLAAVRSDLSKHLAGEHSVYLCDSTMISRERQHEPRRYAMEEERMVTKTNPVAVFVEYFPRRGVLAVNDAAANQYSDVEALAGFLEVPLMSLKQGTPVYADRGFDGRRSIKAVYKAGLRCSIKLEERGSYHGIRKRARRDFNAEGYKAHRGLVEAVFGGLTTKHLSRTRFRKESNVRKWQHALAITHNLQTYMRLFFIVSYI